MGRPVRPFEPTWLDRHFRRDLEALRPNEREECTSLIGYLIADLQACRHPLTDPALSRWRPSSYRGVVKLQPGCHLAEYRLNSTLRVIACYFAERDDILLVVATLNHDHERMKRLLRQHGRSLE